MTRELKEQLDDSLELLQQENHRQNEQRFNGMAPVALAAAAASALIPVAAPALAALIMPAFGLQIIRFKEKGGDYVANSIELHKAMLRTERRWAKELQHHVTSKKSEQS